MIIDVGVGCQSATFTLYGSTTTSRAWDIKTTQFVCGDQDSAGKYWGFLKYETFSILS